MPHSNRTLHPVPDPLLSLLQAFRIEHQFQVLNYTITYMVRFFKSGVYLKSPKGQGMAEYASSRGNNNSFMKIGLLR